MLAGVLRGDGDQVLTEWAARRRRIARTVVRMTDRMTRAANLENHTAQRVRNAVVRLVGSLAAAMTVRSTSG